MKRLALLVILAGCPQKHGAGPTGIAPTGVGCPAATGVYLASYVSHGDDPKGSGSWVLPLHDVRVDSIAGKPEYARLDIATATAAGLPAPPRDLWLLVPGGAPCKLGLGSYFVAAIDSATPNLAYGVELTGCAAPADPSDAVAIALASQDSPAQCHPLAPRIAARLGDTDKAGHWSRPTKETPIPASFASVVPARECAAPTCEKLWSIAEFGIGAKPVAWSGAVNWLDIPTNAPPDTQCTWKVETFSGFFAANKDGAPVQVKPTGHPLVLSTVLADAGGARYLVAQRTGEYAIYELGPDGATLAKDLIWLLDETDSTTADHLGPECEPPHEK